MKWLIWKMDIVMTGNKKFASNEITNRIFFLKRSIFKFSNEYSPKSFVFIRPYRLDSDLIPKSLENFENWKNFMVILFSVKNDAYRRIFGA